MSTHSFFGPSKANMWMSCHGAMAFPENQAQGPTSEFADEGTCAHHFAALCLSTGNDADDYLGAAYKIGDRVWVCNQDMADGIQVYVDDVRRRVGHGMLLVEQKVDLSEWLGTDQFGTADAIIVDSSRKTITVEDLKFGRGERVYASSMDGTFNKQLALYALGAVRIAELFADVHPGWRVELVISQPRVDEKPSEMVTNVEKLLEFGITAKRAVLNNIHVIEAVAEKGVLTPIHRANLTPTDKGCRWCRKAPTCPTLRAKIEAEVTADFDTIEVTPPQLPMNNDALSEAYAALPHIRNWCNAVESMVYGQVSEGKIVNGSDGLPLKLVEGRQGARKWIDSKEAESVLQAILPADKMYAPPVVITAAVAAKLLDRKATKEQWNTYLAPLIQRAPGKPVIALGSDDRAAYSGDATADFQEIDEDLTL